MPDFPEYGELPGFTPLPDLAPLPELAPLPDLDDLLAATPSPLTDEADTPPACIRSYAGRALLGGGCAHLDGHRFPDRRHGLVAGEARRRPGDNGAPRPGTDALSDTSGHGSCQAQAVRRYDRARLHCRAQLRDRSIRSRSVRIVIEAVIPSHLVGRYRCDEHGRARTYGEPAAPRPRIPREHLELALDIASVGLGRGHRMDAAHSGATLRSPTPGVRRRFDRLPRRSRLSRGRHQPSRHRHRLRCVRGTTRPPMVFDRPLSESPIQPLHARVRLERRQRLLPRRHHRQDDR